MTQPPDDELQRQFQALLNQLDETVENDVWQSSAFLKAVGNKLRLVRDEIRIELDTELNEDLHEIPTIANRIAQRTGMIQVFVSLYCANGTKLSQWETVLASLSSTIISRPIYKREIDLINATKEKPKKDNEAYCAVYIKESDIAKTFMGTAPKDEHGHDLLVLKRGSIQPENIISFHHLKLTYTYENKKLILKEPQI
jgi:Dot/Icm secretion system protein IcmQ